MHHATIFYDQKPLKISGAASADPSHSGEEASRGTVYHINTSSVFMSSASDYFSSSFCRAMLCSVRCLSVRPSVTFVSCAKINKDTFEIFSPCGSQAILVFPYRTGWRYSNGNPPNRGVECKGGMKKLTIFDQYLAVSQKLL